MSPVLCFLNTHFPFLAEPVLYKTPHSNSDHTANSQLEGTWWAPVASALNGPEAEAEAEVEVEAEAGLALPFFLPRACGRQWRCWEGGCLPLGKLATAALVPSEHDQPESVHITRRGQGKQLSFKK